MLDFNQTVLVATGKLNYNSYFANTVVALYADHGGYVKGVVLNRPANKTLEEVVKLESFLLAEQAVLVAKNLNISQVFAGGLFLLDDLLLAYNLDNNLVVSEVSLKVLKEFSSKLEHRFIIGGFVWSKPTLKSQIISGCWHVLLGDNNIDFDDVDNMYLKVSRQIVTANSSFACGKSMV